MKMLIAGKWIQTDSVIEVRNPYNQEIIDTVPSAGPSEVEAALASAERGAGVMADLPAHLRAEILKKTAAAIRERSEEIAGCSPWRWASPSGVTGGSGPGRYRLRAVGEEAGRLYGETIPLDAAEGGEGKFGFTLRVPCGVVAAIAPFNFPLHLICHKVGPHWPEAMR